MSSQKENQPVSVATRAIVIAAINNLIDAKIKLAERKQPAYIVSDECEYLESLVELNMESLDEALALFEKNITEQL
jgi:hypothetical protein